MVRAKELARTWRTRSLVCPYGWRETPFGLLHSTTFASLIGIIHEGLQGQGRLGSMMSIFPPWDPRAQSMQRWKAGEKYNITVALNVTRVFRYVEDKQGMSINNTGSVAIPTLLPIQYLCD